MKSLILGTIMSVAFAATVPVLDFVDEMRCRTAQPDGCVRRCERSRPCQIMRRVDANWGRCLSDMSSACTWEPLFYFSFAVGDPARSCADLKSKSLMLSHLDAGYVPPYGPATPSGIKWRLKSTDVEACRRATFTIEMTPHNQNVTSCTMSTAGGRKAYEKFQHLPLKVVDELDTVMSRETEVFVTAQSDTSKVIKNLGLTIRLTIEQKELADKCLLVDGRAPEWPAIVQGRVSPATGRH